MQSTTPRKRLKAVAFDAYGTLFDVLSVTSLCERLFPGRGDALARLWRQKQLQYSVLRSLMGRFKDFWQVTNDGLVCAANILELDLTDADRGLLLDAYLHLTAFPDVKPGLEALKRRRLRLAILSNGAPRMLQAAVASAGLQALFDDIISVNSVRVFKPSPRVYQLTRRRLEAPPAQVGFVSSNSWDVHGAGSAGLYTFWIQRDAGEPEEELGFPARRIVRTIDELESFIA